MNIIVIVPADVLTPFWCQDNSNVIANYKNELFCLSILSRVPLFPIANEG